MIKKIETKEDVLEEINLMSDDSKYKSSDIKSFTNGALWMLDIKNGEIKTLLDKIEKQKKKINEYCTKINDYDSMLFGIEPSRRGRKPKVKIERIDNDGDIEEYQSMYNSNNDGMIEDEDNDISYYD